MRMGSRDEDRMLQREARFRARKADIQRPTEAPDDAVMRVLRVAPELAGMRLDRFVQSQLRATSRTRSQRIVEETAFSPAGKRLKKNHRVRSDERIVLWRPSWEEEMPDAELTIVFEDEALLAVNKPPRIAVHPTARHHRATVTAMLATARPDQHLTLTHRLDRETSGVLLLAKTRIADRMVKLQFEERRHVLKRYLALCWGEPEWQHTTCEQALGPDPNSPYRVKMAVQPSGGQASATTFEVLGRRRRGARLYALLRCTLHTGRQHQIRVHLAHLGLPVVGDKLYGPDENLFARGADGELSPDDFERLELDRQALHAHQLGIDHPVHQGRVELEAPMPPDMENFWDSLAPL
jgi:23S rRNA pseudouridine1911/1915/1917 synthase